MRPPFSRSMMVGLIFIVSWLVIEFSFVFFAVLSWPSIATSFEQSKPQQKIVSQDEVLANFNTQTTSFSTHSKQCRPNGRTAREVVLRNRCRANWLVDRVKSCDNHTKLPFTELTVFKNGEWMDSNQTRGCWDVGEDSMELAFFVTNGVVRCRLADYNDQFIKLQPYDWSPGMEVWLVPPPDDQHLTNRDTPCKESRN